MDFVLLRSNLPLRGLPVLILVRSDVKLACSNESDLFALGSLLNPFAEYHMGSLKRLSPRPSLFFCVWLLLTPPHIP
jgi:hypothetical protein